MTDRFIDIVEAKSRFAELLEAVTRGESVVITRDGRPLARLAPPEAAPAHREKESRRGVTLPPEYEAADVRVARIARESEVPYRLRKTPKH